MVERSKQGRGAGPKGSTVKASGKDGPQIIDTTGHRWSDEAEAVFLDGLSASCNVTRSAAAAGFSTAAIYSRARRDPAFKQRWGVALAHGYHRLEALLLQRAAEALEGYAPDPDLPVPPVSFKDAMAILKMHHATVAGDGKRRGSVARPRSLEEVHRSILTKLEAIEAMRLAGGTKTEDGQGDGGSAAGQGGDGSR